MEKTFKVLVWAGNYVDETRLQQGVYIALRPVLHDKFETIESMKAKLDSYKNIFPDFNAKKAKSSLDKCILVDVDLRIF